MLKICLCRRNRILQRVCPEQRNKHRACCELLSWDNEKAVRTAAMHVSLLERTWLLCKIVKSWLAATIYAKIHVTILSCHAEYQPVSLLVEAEGRRFDPRPLRSSELMCPRARQQTRSCCTCCVSVNA